jgi:Ca2+/Na+ antiporter
MQGITAFISAKTSRILIFGCVYLLVSGLLVLYYSFKTPTKAEDYYQTEINYQKVYFKESADKIVIASTMKEYGLSRGFLKLQGKTDLAEVLRKLNSTTTAEVWLDDKDAVSPFIRGLKTGNFYLPPEIGAEIDNKKNKSMAELFVWFAIGGIAVMIAGFIKFISDKKSKRGVRY